MVSGRCIKSGMESDSDRSGDSNIPPTHTHPVPRAGVGARTRPANAPKAEDDTTPAPGSTYTPPQAGAPPSPSLLYPLSKASPLEYRCVRHPPLAEAASEQSGSRPTWKQQCWPVDKHPWSAAECTCGRGGHTHHTRRSILQNVCPQCNVCSHVPLGHKLHHTCALPRRHTRLLLLLLLPIFTDG